MASGDFEAVCDRPLAGTLDGLEQARRRAAQCYWMALAGCAALLIGFGGLFVASQPLETAARGAQGPRPGASAFGPSGPICRQPETN